MIRESAILPSCWKISRKESLLLGATKSPDSQHSTHASESFVSHAATLSRYDKSMYGLNDFQLGVASTVPVKPGQESLVSFSDKLSTDDKSLNGLNDFQLGVTSTMKPGQESLVSYHAHTLSPDDKSLYRLNDFEVRGHASSFTVEAGHDIPIGCVSEPIPMHMINLDLSSDPFERSSLSKHTGTTKYINVSFIYNN